MITPRALELILEGEIGSIANYIPHPIWPGEGSGITIGVGYDMGQHDIDDLDKDWGVELDDVSIASLGRCCGIRGANAQRFLPSVRNIKIPYASAERVFENTLIPQYEAMTLRAFPGCDKLPTESYGALVFIVYNRGSDTTGPRREEMGAIRQCIIDGNFERIPDLIRSMARLWLGTSNYHGMNTRCSAAADLMTEGLTDIKIRTSSRTW